MLKGKNIFLTGVDGGMGRAMTKVFAQSGANIGANVIRENDEYSLKMLQTWRRFCCRMRPDT